MLQAAAHAECLLTPISFSLPTPSPADGTDGLALAAAARQHPCGETATVDGAARATEVTGDGAAAVHLPPSVRGRAPPPIRRRTAGISPSGP